MGRGGSLNKISYTYTYMYGDPTVAISGSVCSLEADVSRDKVWGKNVIRIQVLKGREEETGLGRGRS